jgi:mono/diheme cytochrome c family protein
LAQREQAESQLNSYGWIDEASGVVRIPINQAMALVAERGLPAGSEAVEEPAPEEAPTAAPAPEVESETPAEERPAAEEAAATPTPESVAEPAAEEPTPEPTVNLAEVSFQAHVLPIFEQHCLKCHGAEDPEEGLILDNYEDIMAGSWNGSVIEPEDVENSYLIEQVVTGRMPKEGDRLTPAEIDILTAWVEAGAPNN